MEIDDAFSASLIDALTIFCKSRLRDLKFLEILENQDVVKFLEYIRQDSTEFIEDEDCEISSIWSAIVRGFEETPILNISGTNSTADEIVSTLSDSSKRAYGALLCTIELIVEICPRCASTTIVQSLYKVFISPILIGHSNSTTFIFNLLQDYKMYFPYSYTFCRRIGRSPTTTLQQWREYFYPKQPSQQQQQIDDVQDLSHDWDMSGLEEGEDSDGEDQKSILGPPTSVLNSPAMTKRRTTRMSTTHQRRGDQRQQPPNNSLSADLLVQMQSSGDGSLLEIQDMSFESPKSTRNTTATSNPKTLSLQSVGSETKKPQQQRSSPTRSENKMNDLSSLTAAAETITVEDLRKAFSQGLDDDDSDLAERGKLASVLKFRYSLPSLALKVQAFHDMEVSWDELRELAVPFLKKSTPMKPPPSSPQQRKKLVTIPTPVPAPISNPGGGNGGQWQDRVFHNYLVDSTDHSPSLRNNNSHSHSEREQLPSPSPYLSLPKAPPRGMTTEQIGEFIFQEVDQHGRGVVSNLDLITALQRHPELAEQLNLSAHSDTLNLFIHKIRSRDSKKITLSEFLRLLQETNDDVEPENEDDPHFHRYPHHHPSHEHPSHEDHRYWEDPHGHGQQPGNVWDSQDQDQDGFPLNPNRISVRSDDILHNARGGGDSPQNLRISREQENNATPLTRSSHHSQSFPLDLHPNAPHGASSHLSASASHLKPPTVESQRPPLHKSYNGPPLPSRDLNPPEESATKTEKRFPSPPSELGSLMRIILEGWLEKKSSKLGIWQKRYFILAFGNSVIQTDLPKVPCIQLQIFKRATESAWGMIPLGLSRIIDIESLSQLLVVSNKKKIDTVFTLTEKMKSAEGLKRHVQEDDTQQPAAASGGNGDISLVRRDSLESITSDDIWTGKSRITTLKAADPEERLLWVNTIRRSMEICQVVP